MIVVVDTSKRSIAVEEGSVLTKLSARVLGSENELGWLPPEVSRDADGQHLWASTAWLREAGAPQTDTAAWQTEFDGMTQYALRKGWLDPQTNMVRMHIERATA